MHFPGVAPYFSVGELERKYITLLSINFDGVIILDLTIPGDLGGREVVTLIREFDKDIPVIVASGYSDDPVMAKPTDFGFSGSICKPFTIKQLGAHLKKVLA